MEKVRISGQSVVIKPAADVKPPVLPLKGDPVQTLNRMLQEANESENAAQNRLLLFMADPRLHGIEATHNILWRSDDDQLLVAFTEPDPERRPVVIYPGFPFSTRLEGLACVVSRGSAHDESWDAQIAQVVSRKRYTTVAEIEQEQAWALKSSLGLQNVTCFDMQPPSFRRALGNDQIPGPAYGSDVLQTVLRLICQWPNTPLREMPIRAPFNPAVVDETCRRLWLNGSIEACEDGTHEMSSRGGLVLQCLEQYSEADFRDAYFIAVVLEGSERGWSNQLLRVAVRIAAILCRDTFAWVDPSARQPLAYVKRQCTGLGRHHAALGGVWSDLGLWQKLVMTEEIEHVKYMAYRSNKTLENLDVSLHQGGEIRKTVMKLEDQLGLPEAASVEGDTSIKYDSPELLELEAELMWSHIDHLAMFSPSAQGAAPTLKEVVSMQPLVHDETDLLDAEQACKTVSDFSKGFLATYRALDRRPDGSYVASGLTAVPMHAVKRISAWTGLSGVQSLVTQYPLQKRAEWYEPLEEDDEDEVMEDA